MRIIPNEESWIGFTTIAPVDLAAPTVDELAAATPLTSYVISINASAQGNQVPTPNLDSLFETSIPGTSTASFTADMYRDTDGDDAWDLLVRGLTGYFFISRFGGTGTNKIPAAGDDLEVWPVRIISRTASAMASNTAQTFTCTASVPIEPAENAIAAAGTGVPTVPLNLTAEAVSSTAIVLDFDAPAFGSPTSYKVYQSSTLGGSYTEVTTNIVKSGTTATVSSLTTATAYFFKVAATNGNGTGPQTAAATATTS